MGLFQPTWWQPPRPGFVFSAIAGTAVTLAMSTGALALDGQAPLLNKSLSPATASLTITGVAPSAIGAGTYVPATVALTLSGVAPTAGTSNVYAPGSGALTFAGQTPTRTIGFVVLTPGSGSLTFDGGYVGVVFTGPDTGSLVLGGQVPLRVTNIVRPLPTGTLTFAGPPVRLDFKPLIPSGAITFAGQAPTGLVQSSTDFTVAPATGTLVFSGTTLTIFKQIVCLPTTGALTISGQLVSLYRINPDSGALTFAGETPLLRRGFFQPIPTGTLTFTGGIPAPQQTVASNLVFRPNTGELTLGGVASVMVVSPVEWRSGCARRIPKHHPLWRPR